MNSINIIKSADFKTFYECLTWSRSKYKSNGNSFNAVIKKNDQDHVDCDRFDQTFIIKNNFSYKTVDIDFYRKVDQSPIIIICCRKEKKYSHYKNLVNFFSSQKCKTIILWKDCHDYQILNCFHVKCLLINHFIQKKVQLLYALLSTFFTVMKYIRSFIISKNVVIMTTPGDFGNLITGMEMSRRLLKRPLFLVFSRYVMNYNYRVSEIFHDIQLIFVHVDYIKLKKRRLINLAYINKFDLWKVLLKFIKTILSLLPFKKVYELSEVQEMLPYEKKYEAIIKKNHKYYTPNSYRMLGWNNLIRKEHSPLPSIPETWRKKIKKAAKSLVGKEKKFCTLHLRNQNNVINAGINRNSDTLRNFSLLLEYLISQDYQVLIISDNQISDESLRHYSGNVLTPSLCCIEDNIFKLFAAIEVDFFIGSPSGGVYLPEICYKPCLILDAFSYCAGFRNSVMYYKTIYDSGHNLIHYQDLFSKYSYDYDFDGMIIQNSSPEEKLNAVKEFLNHYLLKGKILEEMTYDFVPKWTYLYQSKAIISSFWMKKFNEPLINA